MRFHHVHYAVGDPSAAMTDVLTKVDGTRVIVQGLGVGVVADGEYVLFDRDYAADSAARAARPFHDAYAEAITWLHRARVAAGPPDATRLRLAAALPVVPHDHIGFVARDLGATVARLEAAVGAPLHRKEHSVSLIPAPGDYKLWIQVQRAGRVITAPFRLSARSR